MGGVPAVTRHENKSTKQKMKAEHGNRVYDRIAHETACAGNGHRLAPAAASILLNDTTPPGPPPSAALCPTLEASRWRSGNFREDIAINRQTTIMKTTLFTVAFLALLGSFPTSAIGALLFAKTIQGDALCAKHELKETQECQTAIRVAAGTKPVVYYAEPNHLERDFHPKVCRSTLPVTATGTVREREGKRHMCLKDIAVSPQRCLNAL